MRNSILNLKLIFIDDLLDLTQRRWQYTLLFKVLPVRKQKLTHDRIDEAGKIIFENVCMDSKHEYINFIFFTKNAFFAEVNQH